MQSCRSCKIFRSICVPDVKLEFVAASWGSPSAAFLCFSSLFHCELRLVSPICFCLLEMLRQSLFKGCSSLSLSLSLVSVAQLSSSRSRLLLLLSSRLTKFGVSISSVASSGVLRTSVLSSISPTRIQVRKELSARASQEASTCASSDNMCAFPKFKPWHLSLIMLCLMYPFVLFFFLAERAPVSEKSVLLPSQ